MAKNPEMGFLKQGIESIPNENNRRLVVQVAPYLMAVRKRRLIRSNANFVGGFVITLHSLKSLRCKLTNFR